MEGLSNAGPDNPSSSSNLEHVRAHVWTTLERQRSSNVVTGRCRGIAQCFVHEKVRF